MSNLRPCPACHRHVRVSESDCPFCAAVLAADNPSPSKPRATAGRLTRAAIFAGALAGSAAMAGCGTSSPTPEGPNKADHSQPAPADAAVATTDDNGDGNDVESAGDAPDAAVPVSKPVRNPDNIPMPYGAPPARDRLV